MSQEATPRLDPVAQEKYTRIISLMLDKVGDPLEKCQGVIARICALMEVPEPPAPDVIANEKTELILLTLAKAECVLKGVDLIEKSLPDFMNKDIAEQSALNEVDDLASFTESFVAPQTGGGIKKSTNLASLIDNLTLAGYSSQPVQSAPEPGNYAEGHRAFFYEDKTYTGPNGEKKTIRTQAVHDFVPMNNPNELMGPRRPVGKINYEDFLIEDTKRTNVRGGGFSYGAPTDTLRPAAITNPEPVKPSPAPAPITVAPAKPAPAPAPTPAPVAPAKDNDDKPVEIVIPKWTKGPPTTNEEIEEYKKFMVAKYEAEAKQNAEILRQRKLKEGKI